MALSLLGRPLAAQDAAARALDLERRGDFAGAATAWGYNRPLAFSFSLFPFPFSPFPIPNSLSPITL